MCGIVLRLMGRFMVGKNFLNLEMILISLFNFVFFFLLFVLLCEIFLLGLMVIVVILGMFVMILIFWCKYLVGIF